MTKTHTETKVIPTKEVINQEIKGILQDTQVALNERGYDAINQITGYLISNDPAYISSHKGARKIIQSVDRYEIIKELVRYFLDIKE